MNFGKSEIYWPLCVKYYSLLFVYMLYVSASLFVYKNFHCVFVVFLYEVHSNRNVPVYPKSEELQNDTKSPLILPMHCNMKSYHMFKTMLNEIKALRKHAIEVASWK